MLRGHGHQRQHWTRCLFVGTDELLCPRNFGNEDVIGPQDENRLVTKRPRRVKNRCAVAVRAVLVEIGEMSAVREFAYFFDGVSIGGLTVSTQLFDKSRVGPEVVLYQRLSSRHDDGDVGDTGSDEFAHGVLDNRLVSDRQHLLRDGFRQRQQSGAKAGGGNHSLADRGRHRVVPLERAAAGACGGGGAMWTAPTDWTVIVVVGEHSWI